MTEEKGLRRLIIDKLYTHSIYKKDPKPTGDVYWDYFLVSRAFLDCDPVSICILGLGGGTAVHYYNRYFRPERIDGIEINSTMIKVAKEYFDLNHPNLKIINQGAVEYMRETSQKYDLILVDLYEGGGQAKNTNSPEFYADMRRCLTEGGLVAVNRFSLHSHKKLNDE
ncbi:MAG: methyltransferase domain-containing protein, partial [candidate division WWE3 bacterium]|nr:methyltransferase domain-containing protein [candidate division WWE3 bacterium]